ncbi:hypothetical protein [Micromonospora craniellae]|uniref:Uncharacterized protein n=1 Tax=Micromonospora craniellae TaxID=2294034 RepID=A0A372FXZ6_9ACTN|nr:hypothetical protein [Micromonospora craniellae]QOC93766.1 hypothetical protein ID554_09105 [Micromonospora craniellae]RFS45681.1 hypothetical protein D0Q02_15210 [Micromonospora craniellae]
MTSAFKPKDTTTVRCRASYRIPPSRNPRTHQVYAAYTAVARAVSTADAKKMAADLADEIKRNGALGVRPSNKPHEYLPTNANPPVLNPRQQQAKTRVEQLAKQACQDVPQWPGESPQHWGDRVHKRLAELVGNELQPELFLDLKTGAKGLDSTWYEALMNQLPRAFRNVPAITVRC